MVIAGYEAMKLHLLDSVTLNFIYEKNNCGLIKKHEKWRSY